MRTEKEVGDNAEVSNRSEGDPWHGEDKISNVEKDVGGVRRELERGQEVSRERASYILGRIVQNVLLKLHIIPG